MVKKETLKESGASDISLNEDPTNCNFHPDQLPNEVLDQLWALAAEQDRNDLCKAIEEERFRRLAEEMQL